MNRLLLLDGNAILHRAYHALPPLTDPEGHVVNAVYGFVSMMIKLKADLKPTHIAAAFDRPAPTFRKTLYREYQATRPKLDADFIPQIAIVHDILSRMRIPVFEQDGFEADDLIGTVSRVVGSKEYAARAGLPIDQVIIVTGDRDILQLVEEGRVYVSMPTRGLSEAKLYGEKETVERMGVRPEQIADLKALAGDQSDNYPGVEGIGPKTAVTILSKFGSVERLYAELAKGNTNGMGDKLVEKLRAAKETALLMHSLATIRRDVPVEVVLGEVATLDTPEARNALERLGFKSLPIRLSGEPVVRRKAEPKKAKPEKKPEDDGQQPLF